MRDKNEEPLMNVPTDKTSIPGMPKRPLNLQDSSTRKAKWKGQDAEGRKALRQERSVPLMEALHGRIQEIRQQMAPGGRLAQACDYALRQWCRVSVYLARKAKWKGSRCRKILERKLFGKIEAIPEAVWRDFPNEFAPSRLGQIGPLNFVFRV